MNYDRNLPWCSLLPSWTLHRLGFYFSILFESSLVSFKTESITSIYWLPCVWNPLWTILVPTGPMTHFPRYPGSSRVKTLSTQKLSQHKGALPKPLRWCLSLFFARFGARAPLQGPYAQNFGTMLRASWFSSVVWTWQICGWACKDQCKSAGRAPLRWSCSVFYKFNSSPLPFTSLALPLQTSPSSLLFQFLHSLPNTSSSPLQSQSTS